MKIHIPRLRHKKIKDLGKNLHWATSTATKEPNPLENPGGSKNEYFLHEDPCVRRQQIIERNSRTLDKYYNQALKTEDFVSMMERLNKISLKCPEESKPNG